VCSLPLRGLRTVVLEPLRPITVVLQGDFAPLASKLLQVQQQLLVHEVYTIQCSQVQVVAHDSIPAASSVALQVLELSADFTLPG
jgi:hypothetical protein